MTVHPSRGGRRRRSDERGATLILIALFISIIFITAALVIDLSFVRQNRQADKSAADFAVAAGIRSMDNGFGQVQSWKGICAARDYLLSNTDELDGMTETYEDGNGDPVEDGAGIPVPDPCAAPPAVACADGAVGTWGRLVGTADGGRIRVTIASGYDLSSSGFAEDSSTTYSGDTGDGPCDNLAVIIEEGEGAYFGGVAGVSGYETTIRSVARLERGNPDIPAALILLERHDCRTLSVSGSGAWVVVSGTDKNPGAVHADSLGDGANCNDKIFSVNGSVPPPRIVSQQAPKAGPNGVAPGEITAVALTSASGAEPDNVSAGLNYVCAKEVATDCGNPSTGIDPQGRELVGRVVADEKYLEPIRALRSRAETRFAITDSTDADDKGYKPYACNDPGPFAIIGPVETGDYPNGIWIDCSTVGGKTFDAKGKVFDPISLHKKEIVINGDLTISGSDNSLKLASPSAVYVRGYSQNAVTMGSNDFFLNDGGLTDLDTSPDDDGYGFVCDERYAISPTARTELVIGKGRVSATGGTLRLCQTTLYLMDDSGGATGCPLPSAVTDPGLAPYGNNCQGNVSVSGGAKIDWTAPNQDDVNATEPGDTLLDELEDLALWSETSGQGGSSWSVGGSGGLYLGGVFVTPNADPFSINGGGSIDIVDAQFVSRKLVATGTGYLRMAPQSQNSLKIPPLEGFTLVR